MIAQILTPYIGDGTMDSPTRPQIGDEYMLNSWRDVTDQQNPPRTPNLYIVEIYCDALTLAEIEADSTYYILWSDAK